MPRNKACHDPVCVGVYGMRVRDVYECVCMCTRGEHLCPCMCTQGGKRGTECPASHSSRLSEAEVAGFGLGWLANSPSDAAFSAHPDSQPEVKGAQSQAGLLDEWHGSEGKSSHLYTGCSYPLSHCPSTIYNVLYALFLFHFCFFVSVKDETYNWIS